MSFVVTLWVSASTLRKATPTSILNHVWYRQRALIPLLEKVKHYQTAAKVK